MGDRTGGRCIRRMRQGWHDFRRIRATLDPHCVFLNGYLSELLDANGPMPSDTTKPEAVKGYGIPQKLS